MILRIIESSYFRVVFVLLGFWVEIQGFLFVIEREAKALRNQNRFLFFLSFFVGIEFAGLYNNEGMIIERIFLSGWKIWVGGKINLVTEKWDRLSLWKSFFCPGYNFFFSENVKTLAFDTFFWFQTYMNNLVKTKRTILYSLKVIFFFIK